MPIRSTSNKWVLETQNSAYAIGLNDAGLLANCYWRERLPNLTDYPAAPNGVLRASFDMPQRHVPEEFPGYSALRYTDPAFMLTFADGVRDFVPKFVCANVKEGKYPELVLCMRDEHYPLQISLHYRVYEQYDLIGRWATFDNIGDSAIQLERAFSAKWSLPHAGEYSFSHMYGRHINEFNLTREKITPGLKSIESHRLTTSHHHAPWFGIDTNATEDSGEVWFGTLAWSGNWKISAEGTEFGGTRVNIGLNDFDFGWVLNPNQIFTTPEAISGYVKDGFGAASRRMHNYVRENLLPHKDAIHKVLYNSWEATTFNVDEVSQAALAEIAANMGVELFVMDDGWFKNRNLDNAGLGDWIPDARKFPNGLGGLIKKVNKLGMDFGIWVEPEMVNADSDLYRAHPEWVIHFPTRERTEARQQMILNLARADVQNYILERLSELLSKNKIRFVKWDMNRNVSEPGWAEAPGDQREIWVRYVEGLYHVWGTLQKKFPDVIWQSCSGGGGRADYGILRFTDQIWISDNTEAIARLSIQEGFSQFLPAHTMEAWVTDWAEDLIPLEFRFHVSMCGNLGIGGNLNAWSEKDRALASKCVAKYKQIRHIIQLGDQYRLISPQKKMASAVQYLSKDKSEGVLFLFRVYVQDPDDNPMVYLRGLEPLAIYDVEGFSEQRSGAGWMAGGLQVKLPNMGSKVLKIRKVSEG